MTWWVRSTKRFVLQHLFISTYADAGCVSVFDFISLFYFPVGIPRSEIGLKIFAITAGIKKYKSITKKKRKKHCWQKLS